MAFVNTNSTSSWNQTKYARTVSALLFTKSVAMSLANTELRANMPDGNTITRPTTSFLGIQQYSPNNTGTYDNLTLGSETLVINDTPMVIFTLDQINEDDAGWNISMNTMENVAKLLREYVDGKFFAQVLNFGNNFGSTVALSSTNAVQTLLDGAATLINAGADETKLVAVLDAFGVSKVGQNAISSGFNLSDKTYVAGWTGKEVAGTQLVVSANLTMVGTYALGTGNPSNAQTVKLNGYTFTFVSSIGSTAGNVLIGATATDTIANLNSAINGTAGAGTTYVAPTSADRNKYLRGFSSTASTTTLTFTSTRGYRGASAFAKTTASNNKFGQFVIYATIMEDGAINMVMRDNVKSVTGRVPASLVYEYLTWSRFGLKVFADGAERGLILPLEARAAE